MLNVEHQPRPDDKCLLEMNLTDIYCARDRQQPYVRTTPVFTNSTFDNLIGRNVFFKAENLQKTGSFKARGALNAVSIKRITIYFNQVEDPLTISLILMAK